MEKNKEKILIKI